MIGTSEILRRAWSDDSGQDLIEYALVAALIALAAITGMKNVSTSIKTSYTYIGSTVANNL